MKGVKKLPGYVTNERRDMQLPEEILETYSGFGCFREKSLSIIRKSFLLIINTSRQHVEIKWGYIRVMNIFSGSYFNHVKQLTIL